MVCPLYKLASGQAPSSKPDNGHAGLWFDKFCDQWQVDALGSPHPVWSLKAEDARGKTDSSKANPKLTWIDTLTGKPIGVKDDLAETTTRLIRLSQARGGLALVFRLESDFVTGLGRSHPLENGFAWHHTLGTPFLPGSSIKGLLLAWVRTLNPPPDSDTVQRLFGDRERVGSLSFLDAVPIAPVTLKGDVLTPHYANWSPDDPPGDWRSPKPVPFLVTAKELRLLFPIVPRTPPLPGDLKLVEEWLIEALRWAGAGAKTAVGYGRMAYDPSTTKALLQAEQQRQQELHAARNEAERLANLDPLDRELEDLAKTKSNPTQPDYQLWIHAIEARHWGEQSSVIRRVLDRIVDEMKKAKHWKEGSERARPNKHVKTTTKVKALLSKYS